MAKKVLSIKLEPEAIESLKTQAALNNTTVTDVITSGITSSKDQDYLRKKIEMLENQLQDVTQRYQNATGRKIRLDKRVSISLSLEQFKALNMAAARDGKSKSKFLQDIIFPKQEQKALSTTV